MAQNKQAYAGLAVCIRNDGYEVALERRKIYRVVADSEAAKYGQMRVVDESGDDYVYPQAFFIPVDLPQSVQRAVIEAA